MLAMTQIMFKNESLDEESAEGAAGRYVQRMQRAVVTTKLF
jgi:hypothetical protein